MPVRLGCCAGCSRPDRLSLPTERHRPHAGSRRCHRGGLHHSEPAARIGAAEATRQLERGAHPEHAAADRHDVQLVSGPGVRGRGRRHRSVLQAQNGEGRLDGTGGSQRVADDALVGSDRRSGRNIRRSKPSLTGIVQRCGRPVALTWSMSDRCTRRRRARPRSRSCAPSPVRVGPSTGW